MHVHVHVAGCIACKVNGKVVLCPGQPMLHVMEDSIVTCIYEHETDYDIHTYTCMHYDDDLCNG